MYCGRKLANGHPLRLRNHSFLNVVVRRKPTNPEGNIGFSAIHEHSVVYTTHGVIGVLVTEAIPPPTKEKAVESLTRLMRPEYRAAVEAVCSSGDKIDQIIASVPELRTDLIAQGKNCSNDNSNCDVDDNSNDCVGCIKNMSK